MTLYHTFCTKQCIVYVVKLLDAFATLRKATISFIISVRAHVTIRLPPDGFSWNLIVFWKSVEKIHVSLISDKNNGYLTWISTCTYDNTRWIILRMENVSGKSCRENRNTPYFSITFFIENLAVYMMAWKNMVKPGQATDVITWRMRSSCWRTKATDTHSEYVILIAFPLQQWLHEHASMLRYTYIACIVLNCSIMWRRR